MDPKDILSLNPSLCESITLLNQRDLSNVIKNIEMESFKHPGEPSIITRVIEREIEELGDIGGRGCRDRKDRSNAL